jgi:hypothetical protein
MRDDVVKVDPERLYGVVSGDVVGSSKLDALQREALYQVMREGSAELRRWLGTAMPLEVDIYGGDSWQILLKVPGKALAAGLFYRAFLRSRSPQRDTRFVVSVGPVDFVPRNKVSEGDGAAFRLSGQGLVELKKRRMAFVSHDRPATSRWDLVFELIDAVAVRWSDKRALAVVGALHSLKQEEIGQLWSPPIEQATVNTYLKAANWSAVKRAVIEFQEFWAAFDSI